MSQYIAGTVSVTNGSQTVTGVGTLWLAAISPGNLFTVLGTGVPYVVGSVNSDTSITLSASYAGTTASGVSYGITTSFTPNIGLPYPQKGDADTATTLQRMAVLIDQNLANPGVTINATSTTSFTPGMGSKTFASQTGKQFAYPQYLLIASAASSTNYMIGQVTAYNPASGSLTVNVVTFGGSGAHTDWQISLTGVPGLTVTFVDKETPTGLINGTNATFTLAVAPSPASSCEGRLRSGGVGAFLPLIKDIDFTLSGTTITMTTAPKTGSNLFFNSRH